MHPVKNGAPTVSRLALVLAAVAGSACALPAMAQTAAPSAYKLHGVVRDFSPSQADFAPAAAANLATSAGNVAATLNSRGMPAYTGAGKLVTTPAHDAQGRPIAPSMVTAAPVTTFNVSGGSVSSSRPVAAKVTVIGAAISSGNYDCAVTMKIHAGSSALSPFGSFDGAISGNVNNASPHAHVLPSMIVAGDAISIDARSWTRKNASSPSTRDSDWQAYMTVNSANGANQVKALRNGDPVPSVAGYNGQSSAKTFLKPYVDSTTNKIKLAANQVIYLFELGTSSSSSAAFDMQDLVVLVDLATDPSYFSTPAPAAPAGCVMLEPAVPVELSVDGVEVGGRVRVDAVLIADEVEGERLGGVRSLPFSG